jgi:nucleoside-diphosphate-sugar epimerase
MKLFLTGGTGFIGSHFINHAHASGHEIVALKRSKESIPRIALNQEPIWIECALTEIQPRHLAGCDTIVHLAAHSANVPYDTLENCIIHNVLEPIHLIRMGIAAGVKRFIIAGSYFEYGKSCERYEDLPADAALEPTNRYAASKAAASVVLKTLAMEEKIELIILRIFQAYGEGELETRFWPTLKRKALAGEDMPMSEGTQIRDFVPVATVVKAFLNAVSRDDLVAGLPVCENVGSGKSLSLADFAKAEWHRFQATGSLLLGALPMRPGEVHRITPKMENTK